MIRIKLPYKWHLTMDYVQKEVITNIRSTKKNDRGILVNALAPGATETALFLKGKSQENIDKLNVMNAFKRLAKPIKIGRLVLFLASDDSKWISSQIRGAIGALV